MGDVEMAKVLRAGSLFVKERNKALHIESICKKTVSERRVLDQIIERLWE